MKAAMTEAFYLNRDSALHFYSTFHLMDSYHLGNGAQKELWGILYASG